MAQPTEDQIKMQEKIIVDFVDRAQALTESVYEEYKAQGVNAGIIGNGIVNAFVQCTGTIYADFLKQINFPPDKIREASIMHFIRTMDMVLGIKATGAVHVSAEEFLRNPKGSEGN